MSRRTGVPRGGVGTRHARRGAWQLDRRSAFAVAFGAHVQGLRLQAGLRQIDLAGPALSRAAIAKIEGGRSSPSLAALAHLHGCLMFRFRG